MKAMGAVIAVLLWGMELGSSALAMENNTSMHPLARVFGLCKGVPASLAYQGIPFSLGPLGNAQQYLKLYENQDLEVPPTTQVTVVVAPNHGKFIVRPAMSTSGYAGYDYMPEAGYAGKDSLTLRVELGDKPITLKFFFNIQNVGDDAADDLCRETGETMEDILCSYTEQHHPFLGKNDL